MAEIINLRNQRRQRERAAAAQAAADNRARFGRTPAEAKRDAQEAEKLRLALDGARIEPDTPTEA